ncbi:MAG: hypothetical protein K2M75_07960 [Clostridia bacterium]|nr:hypothetical protein [Clostridia bacterium]
MKNYKTRVHLVEPTKLLERVTVDNMRFLNPLGHDFEGGAYYISPILSSQYNDFAIWKRENGKHPITNIRNELYKNVYLPNSQFIIATVLLESTVF